MSRVFFSLYTVHKDNKKYWIVKILANKANHETVVFQNNFLLLSHQTKYLYLEN